MFILLLKILTVFIGIDLLAITLALLTATIKDYIQKGKDNPDNF